jgi:hypothetical protein
VRARDSGELDKGTQAVCYSMKIQCTDLTMPDADGGAYFSEVTTVDGQSDGGL